MKGESRPEGTGDRGEWRASERRKRVEEEPEWESTVDRRGR